MQPSPDYVDLYDYLKYKYGLLKCGSGKAFLLLSDRPEKEDEFRCMMAGETYDSQHQNFHIASDNISQICQTNHAQYDYYQVYMSEMVVACIMENFSENMEERIDITATYAFNRDPRHVPEYFDRKGQYADLQCSGQ